MVTVIGVTPSVYVNVKGAVPVKLKVTLGNGLPAQMEPPPKMVAAGTGFTTTATDPPKLVALQVPASVSEVML